jgi:hypothetical protein
VLNNLVVFVAAVPLSYTATYIVLNQLEKGSALYTDRLPSASVYSLGALCGSSSAFGFEFLLQLDEAPA